jgi:hypothetical protein
VVIEFVDLLSQFFSIVICIDLEKGVVSAVAGESPVDTQNNLVILELFFVEPDSQLAAVNREINLNIFFGEILDQILHKLKTSKELEDKFVGVEAGKNGLELDI